MGKLSSKDLHLLRLIAKGDDHDKDGWAPVSAAVWPLMAPLPIALVERRPLEIGGQVRLTDTGKIVLEWS